MGSRTKSATTLGPHAVKCPSTVLMVLFRGLQALPPGADNGTIVQARRRFSALKRPIMERELRGDEDDEAVDDADAKPKADLPIRGTGRGKVQFAFHAWGSLALHVKEAELCKAGIEHLLSQKCHDEDMGRLAKNMNAMALSPALGEAAEDAKDLCDYWRDPKQRRTKPFLGYKYDDHGRPIEDDETTEDEARPTAPNEMTPEAPPQSTGANGSARPVTDPLGVDA